MHLSSNLCPPPLMRQNLEENDECYEILSYNGDTQSTAGKPTQSKKRSRRKSSSNASEMVLRKEESRVLHSTIEKRRRLKISREFEALKFLIPACRNTTATTIDGMQKLVILKASVEYIQYLHHIVRQQNSLIRRHDPTNIFDDSFADVKVDVNSYRDLTKDFNFSELAGSELINSSRNQLPMPPSPIADANLGTSADVDPCLYQLEPCSSAAMDSEPRSNNFEAIAGSGMEGYNNNSQRVKPLRKVRISTLLN